MIKLFSILTGTFKLDGGAMFGVVPKTIWQKKYPADENNLCTLETRCLLIQDGDKNILVDTGLGDKQSEKFFGYYFLDRTHSLEKSLLKHNVLCSQITDVIITHFHFDHVGGAVKKTNDKLVPTFENATYYTNQEHWDAALNPNEREAKSFFSENILPLKESNKLKFIQVKKDIQFTDNIRLRFYYGHTTALMIPIIKYKDKEIVYVADLIPFVMHLPLSYVCGYDTQPLISMQEKKEFLNEAFEKKWILFFEHDHYTECCSLKKDNNQITVDKTFTLNDI